MARVEPTHEQLEQSFRAMRKSHWPPTLEEALQDEIYGRLVRTIAARVALGQRVLERATQRPAVIRPEPPAAYLDAPPVPRAAKQQPLPTPRSEIAFDRKRAAAGEREDD